MSLLGDCAAHFTRFARAFSAAWLVCVGVACAQSAPPYSQSDAWVSFTFAKRELKTSYRVERDAEKGVVLHAIAEKSASAKKLVIEAPAEKLSSLKWSWKIGALPVGGSSKAKETDDYAARVYVAFQYDPAKVNVLTRAQFGLVRALYGQYPPIAALSYVVDPELPVGTIVDNPFTSRVKMIVVDNSRELGQWRSFERNIAQAYQKAFGVPPPTNVAGIVLMTDADNTQTRAEAWFGPISLSVLP
jgi:hypothetical protein